jgi:hypothetical protein
MFCKPLILRLDIATSKPRNEHFQAVKMLVMPVTTGAQRRGYDGEP